MLEKFLNLQSSDLDERSRQRIRSSTKHAAKWIPEWTLEGLASFQQKECSSTPHSSSRYYLGNRTLF
jgi:hypothetical protein